MPRLDEQVRALYRRNRQRGFAAWCGREYDFVCPARGTYPFQWFWDSCFHAIVLSRFDVERAQRELTSLVANQHPDGFISHVTLWQRALPGPDRELQPRLSQPAPERSHPAPAAGRGD